MSDRQRLKDELTLEPRTDQAKEAYAKVWRAENEATLKQALKDQQSLLAQKRSELKKWDAATQAKVKTWFGKADTATRDALIARIDRVNDLSKSTTIDKFKPADPSEPGVFAYVLADDKDRHIYIDKAFEKAPSTGTDSRAGTLSHEMSHFQGIGDTEDHIYGPGPAKALAKKDPAKALENADNFEYFLEDAK